MEENLKLLFEHHLPGLRLRALQVVEDAFHAERVLNALYLYSEVHAEELVNHPEPRAQLIRLMSGLMEQGRGRRWSYRGASPQPAAAR